MEKRGKNVTIHHTAKIDVEYLVIGDFTTINANAHIHGKKVEIGREAWIGEHCWIGGGRAEMGELKTGDFLHCGPYSHLNIADKLIIGNEVGIGIETKIFTHGSYLDELRGFPFQQGPVTIGNNVWLPNAWVNPNVTIGDNVVVGAMSLVNKNLPSGCFAGGVPSRVIRERAYPKILSKEQKKSIIRNILNDMFACGVIKRAYSGVNDFIKVDKTSFHFNPREIEGKATKQTEIAKNVLRRHGIRFRYFNDNGIYRNWNELEVLK